MLISKQTYCFACGNPTFGRRAFNPKEDIYFLDTCTHCKAFKTTLAVGPYAGSISYHFPDGRIKSPSF